MAQSPEQQQHAQQEAARARFGAQLDEEARWLCRVRETLEKASAEALGAAARVFDVPRALRDTKPDAYTPQHFALGPYHQGRPHLKDMERYKLAAAKRAERLFAGGRRVGHLVLRFIDLQGQIRGPYHRFLELSDETLAWMMAIDTCFLLDFLEGYDRRGEATDMVSSATNWINATVRDAMMLENQLPLSLFARNLQLRYDSDAASPEQAATDALHAVLDRFIKDVSPIKICADMAIADFTKQAHLLELLYHFLVPDADGDDDHTSGGKDTPPPEMEDDPEKQQLPEPDAAEYGKLKKAWLKLSGLRVFKSLISRPAGLVSSLSGQLARKAPVVAGVLPVIGKLVSSVDVQARLQSVNLGHIGAATSPLAQEIKIPSVAQLAACGVRFAPAPEGIAGIAFDEATATLSLPVVTLDGNTEVVLRNLVAYEAVAVRGPLVLARWTELMNGVVDTAKDVKILRQSGVVVNRMKSNREAAAMWNGMCRAARLSRVPRLDRVIRAVNAHRNRTASVRAGKMLRKYVFRSWKVLTLLASVLLLLMTALETFCSAYPCQSSWFGGLLDLPKRP